MLAAIIDDKNNNAWSELVIKKTDNTYSLSGFSVVNGMISEFKREYLQVFKTFILSNSQQQVGSIDGYEVILDNENGLYHFFKNGKEDFYRFLLYNSKGATVYNGNRKNNNSIMRKIAISSLGVFLIVDLASFTFLCTQAFNEEYSVEYNYGNYIKVEENPIFNTITYSYNQIENTVKRNISADDIKSLIFSSSNLNEEEKNYIWNPSLVNLVLPYYQGTNFEVVTLVRHTDIGIKSFDGLEEGTEDWNGYYSFDNWINVKDYIREDIKNRLGTIGHEYIHLLQVSTTPSFIVESSAELMSREFFLKTSSSNGTYSYHDACIYLKILMEIVGPQVILDSNFCTDSVALQEAVRNYFSNEEYNEFFHIMNLSPHYDKEELKQGGYQKLYDLLSVLYNRKFGKDIKDDSTITCILNGGEYNRVYFNDELRSIDRDYIMVPKSFKIEDAIDNGYVSVRVRLDVSKDEYDSFDGIKLWRCISSDDDKVAMVSGGPPIGVNPERDAKFPQIVDLVASGDLYVKYSIEINADSKEYLKLLDAPNIYDICYDLSDGYFLNKDRNIIYRLDECEKIYIDGLQEKISNVHQQF